jgi:hypothetical protein
MSSLSQVLDYARAFSLSDWLRQITSEHHIKSLLTVLLDVDFRIWYFLFVCASVAFLSRIAIEILAFSQPHPAENEPVERLPPIEAIRLKAAAHKIEHSEAPVVDATALDRLRRRLRALELECDTLRAEAQRSNRLEAELAAANMRVEELSHMLSSSRATSSPRALPSPVAPAAAATPMSSTPLKISHRTPSSTATKSLTVRASLLPKGQATPTATPSLLR